MARRWPMVRTIAGLLGVGFVGCFRGEFLAGDPCQSSADCGPHLECEDGLCGGLIEPNSPVLELAPSPVKQFRFSWKPSPEVESYQLFERLAPEESWVLIRDDIPSDRGFASFSVPLYFRLDASYKLRACNSRGCAESAPVSTMESTKTLASAIGYFKASNADASDYFGTSLALSADGTTLAVGAPAEDSDATRVDGPETNNSVFESGAVYVFVRADSGRWSQQAYLKASNAEFLDSFGASLAMSADGNTIAVGAPGKDAFRPVFGEEPDEEPGEEPDEDFIVESGGAYVFVRNDDGKWSEQSYLEAPDADIFHFFSASLALSADGDTLAAGAPGEDSNTTGIDGEPTSPFPVHEAGAVYVFVRDDANDWLQEAYVKASNPGARQVFGWSVALNADGDTLAVGAPGEDSNATGIDGDQDDRSSADAGAAYVFVRDGNRVWSQQAYVKSSNAKSHDWFGSCLALDASGDTLAVGALGAGREMMPSDDAQAEELLPGRGTVYLYVRDESSTWSHQTELRPSTIDPNDGFGGGDLSTTGVITEITPGASMMIALSDDGHTLAIGASLEDGGAEGFAGDPTDDSAPNSGAVYLFVRDDKGTWSDPTYLKASNTSSEDRFGSSLALSADGNTLAVGAVGEDSRATGIEGEPDDQANDNAQDAGAVYLY